jgi:chaperonin GroES
MWMKADPMPAHFRPLRDCVLLKRVEYGEKTPSGIIIPDTAREKPVEAEVLAVGPARRTKRGNCWRWK